MTSDQFIVSGEWLFDRLTLRHSLRVPVPVEGWAARLRSRSASLSKAEESAVEPQVASGKCKTRGTSPWLKLLITVAVVSLAVTATRAQEPASPNGDTSAHAADPHLGKAYDDLKNELFDDAVKEFRAALEADPTLVLRARFPMAVALYQLRRLDEALTELQRVRNEAGDHPNVLYYLGRVEFDQGHLEAAIRDLTAAAAQSPFPDTAYYLGYAYLKNGEFPAAEKWLQRAREAAPRDEHVEERLAQLYQQEGKHAEAQQAAEMATKLRERAEQVSELRLNCARKLETGSLEDARPVCAQLYDPEDAEKLTMLGTLYGQRGDYQDAEEPLRRATELEPNSPQMLYNYALNEARLGRFESARAPLEKAVERWPDLFPVNSLLGTVLFQLGEDSAALETLRRAHQLEPEDRATLHSLYQVLLRLGEKNYQNKQYPAAIENYSEASKLRPYEPQPHRRLAEIYEALNQPSKAAEERKAAGEQ